jgi:hypothetical protein
MPVALGELLAAVEPVALRGQPSASWRVRRTGGGRPSSGPRCRRQPAPARRAPGLDLARRPGQWPAPHPMTHSVCNMIWPERIWRPTTQASAIRVLEHAIGSYAKVHGEDHPHLLHLCAGPVLCYEEAVTIPSSAKIVTCPAPLLSGL